MNKTEFIDKVVLGWIKHDLIRMQTLLPDKSQIGNINFPLALCTLSYMEYLGGFLVEGDRNFKNNVDKYIKECFTHPNEYKAEVLRDLIRNGLAHGYFPIGAISRNNKRPATYKGNTYSIVLDTETLVNDFIDSLKVFTNKLEADKYEARRQEAVEENDTFQARHRTYIDRLEGQSNDDEGATPSRGIGEGDSGPGGSGASGYNGPIDDTTTP